MSYDLMVFDLDAAPSEPKAFMAWYDTVTEWSEGHDYADPSNASAILQSWYRDMLASFPAMNGPDAKIEDDEMSNTVSDYCIAKRAIYIAFAWSVAEASYRETTRLAEKHGLGFFDASGPRGQVWGPKPGGQYALLFECASA
jgi:hypothetical protein